LVIQAAYSGSLVLTFWDWYFIPKRQY